MMDSVMSSEQLQARLDDGLGSGSLTLSGRSTFFNVWSAQSSQGGIRVTLPSTDYRFHVYAVKTKPPYDAKPLAPYEPKHAAVLPSSEQADRYIFKPKHEKSSEGVDFIFKQGTASMIRIPKDFFNDPPVDSLELELLDKANRPICRSRPVAMVAKDSKTQQALTRANQESAEVGRSLSAAEFGILAAEIWAESDGVDLLPNQCAQLLPVSAISPGSTPQSSRHASASVSFGAATENAPGNAFWQLAAPSASSAAGSSAGQLNTASSAAGISAGQQLNTAAASRARDTVKPFTVTIEQQRVFETWLVLLLCPCREDAREMHEMLKEMQQEVEKYVKILLSKKYQLNHPSVFQKMAIDVKV